MKYFKKCKFNKKVNVFIVAIVFVIAFLTFGLISLGKSDAAATQYPSYFCLRDKYYIEMDDQGQYGTCWSFANTKSLEEWLAEETGEHFELSETYYTLDSPAEYEKDNLPYQKLVGNGGNALFIYDSIKNRDYGILMGSDLPYSDIHYLNVEDATKLKTLLKTKADADTIEDIACYRANLKDDRTSIKYFLQNYGNCSISLDNWGTITNTNSQYGTVDLIVGSTGGHALNVIGWDDNYECFDKSRGAFIILNSHGDYAEDGIVYLPYSSKLYSYRTADDIKYGQAAQNVIAFSYELKLAPDYVYLTSNSNYILKTKNKYSKTNGFAAQEFTTAEKNIFYVDDDYQLKYTFPSEQGLEYDLSIWRGDVNVSQEFIIYKDDYDCKIARRKDLDSGSYKVKISYSYMKNGKKVEKNILKQIFLMDGLEFNNIECKNPEGYYEWLNVNSLTMEDNNIYVNNYPSTTNTVNLNMYFSSYSNIAEVALTQNGKNVGQAFKANNSTIKITIDSRYLNMNGDNKFVLTLSNEKYSKNYNLIVKTDNLSPYNPATEQYKKMSVYLFLDLAGGQLDENVPSKIVLSNYEYKTYELENPQKEGYIFTGYEYFTMNDNWAYLPKNNARDKYYIELRDIRISGTGNFFSSQVKVRNYYNSVIVRATYVEDVENPISVTSGSKSGEVFEYYDQLTLSLNILNATSVMWTVDGVELQSNVTKLMPGNHKITVSYLQDNILHTRSKDIYIKYHLFQVVVGSTEFEYNKQVQVPSVSIDGLEQMQDYTLKYQNSIDAGQYKIVILLNDPLIKLSQYEVAYTIKQKPVTIKYKNQFIKQGESPKPFEYTIQGWDESDGDFVINFDLGAIDLYEIGDFIVDRKLPELSSNYQIIEIEPPHLVIESADFETSEIHLISQNEKGASQDSYVYGQPFVIKLDCFAGMIEEITYQLTNKSTGKKLTYSSKELSGKIPVGQYTVDAQVKLVNDEQFNRSIELQVEKASIKIQAISAKGYKGQEPKNLQYKITSDYPVDDLSVSIKIENFNKNKVGSYVLVPVAEGEGINNYEIEYVSGTYQVVKRSLNKTSVIVLSCFGGMVLLIVCGLIITKIRKKRAH